MHRNEHFRCLLCEEDLQKQSEQERQTHYDQHFSEEIQQPAQTSSLSTTSPKNVFWHPSMLTPTPDNFTPNLIPLLKKSLSISHQRGYTRKAVLCHLQAVHVSVENWDRGWGCGYRNFLMACVPLIEQKSQPAYAALLRDQIPPGVQNLQLWIENAWATGYDAEGAQQLKRKLVDTKKWIGTAELFVAFSSRGIPSQLVDFQMSVKGSENKLTDWMVNYFDPPTKHSATVHDALLGAQAINITERMPVILQHQGHSRIIIGYEMTKTGSINLLAFDPSKTPKSFVRKAALNNPVATTRTPSPRKLSSRIKQTVKRSFDEIKSKKRKLGDGDHNTITLKRSRGERDVIVIDSDDEHTPVHFSLEDSKDGLQEIYRQVLKFARVNSTSLSRSKYQVLFFPLSPPLNSEERRVRRVVTSQKI